MKTCLYRFISKKISAAVNRKKNRDPTSYTLKQEKQNQRLTL
jgi:hypothetical protein